jgi:Mg2+-importing ATPase
MDSNNEYINLAKLNQEDIIKYEHSNINGLNNKQVEDLLETNGLNIVVKKENKSRLRFLIESFNDKFIFILLILAIINYILGDALGSYIIIGIAIVSALIKYFQNYSVYKFNKKLKSELFSTAQVLRNYKIKEINIEKLVVGDIVKLNAGTLIPADIMLLETKDLFVNQSTFTGENIPIEKTNTYNESLELFNISNICYMGSSVTSGTGTGIVIKTGFNTYLGNMSKNLNKQKDKTNFEIGIDKITNMLIKYMLIVSLLVLLIYGFIRHDFLEAILFALSVAVGITPSMLPMIVNVNLTKGTKALAHKKTLVKDINSIQNLGAMDLLCTDKTGTLTEDKIVLQKYLNVEGEEDESIIEYAFLNSYFGTGIKNIIDKAIISYSYEYKKNNIINDYEKIDEIPFDYERKRMSIVVEDKNTHKYRMLTKGALEVILPICTKIKYKDKIVDINSSYINKINQIATNLSKEGMQVIALATKREYTGINIFNKNDESNMVFVGLVAFLDPPKKDVKSTLEKLKKYGIETKIITGDNQYATEKICNLIGIDTTNIIVGSELDKLSDEEAKQVVEYKNIFARMNPIQKERVIKLLRTNGHVVGYMGDGVNDAPSLKCADVGISVNNSTDIAKESSDLILLEKNLEVIYDGVKEGRTVYGNIIKYMKLALSSDFGDVFSIVISSIFLPFLPLLPIQMLLQDFLFDISQVAIPYDDVDEEFLLYPRKWNTKGLSRFMNVMGITSSIIDVIAFIVFWFVFKYNGTMETYFQTAWFVECLISETLIIHFIRTSKIPFITSKANNKLTICTILTIICTILTPIILHTIPSFHFELLPIKYYIFVAILSLLYGLLVQIVKVIYIDIYHEWL